MDLKSMYRDVILDHYKKPRNAGELPGANREAKCKNPSCGDRITLALDLRAEQLAGVSFVGTGCAISQASASMMTQAIKGKSTVEVQAIKDEFRKMILAGQHVPDKEILGDLITLQGIAKLPARVKCALCGWSALEAALEQHGSEVDLDLDKTLPNSELGANGA
ncbi:SUF system NifU family Fe-S cluster assembly protein [bacterium]|nr:SUF system NifU family Fe-S cluster assembly protein [bacterium]